AACGAARCAGLRTAPPAGWGTTSQRPQEGDEVALLLRLELEPEDEVEELDGVLQGQAAAVVQVRRAVLDAAQGERLDRAVARLVEEALQVQVVHLVVEGERRRVGDGTPGLAGGQLLAPPLAA